ncbi:MAG: hypothetical protein MUC68_10580 [Burkholderiaceae bacterium]|jgi:hypothetical protein|nr:hypothetical protein [Burkholderiaceae bacterium]
MAGCLAMAAPTSTLPPVAGPEVVRAVVAQALRGHEHAIAMVDLLHFIAQVWDDLIDRDRAVPDAEVHRAFYAALIDLPRNPFYRSYAPELLPVMTTAILNWHAANALRRDDRPALREAANVLRCRMYDVVMLSAAIIGGPAHAQAWAPRVAQVIYDEPQEA